MECSRFLDRIPGTGLKIAGDRNTEQLLSFMPGLFNIALLELFGLVSLQHGKPAEGKGWNIHRAHRVLFGDALLSAACTLYSADDFWLDLSDDEVCNKFQSVMQNYFPEWRNNLSMLETGFRDGTFILKVAHGKVWRRIAVRGEWSLEDLSSSILQAFDFDNDHLHCFTYKTRFGSSMRVHHPYMDEPPFTSDVRIGDVPLCEGESMEYVFDFGDHWEFNVKLESVEPVDRKMKKHMVIEKHGEAPAQYGHWNDEDEEWD